MPTDEPSSYQMRNFYEQLGDGFFSPLDTMNYIQHTAVLKYVHDDDNILDMCCGRGLLLPLLRFMKKSITSYTGVDVSSTNAVFRTRRVTDNKPIQRGYYPFQVFFAKVNVAEMTTLLPEDHYDVIVYTSSIEHMLPDAGKQSLVEARKVAKLGATLFLSGPITPEGQDGYETQYDAHVYEWKRSEIEQGLRDTGWSLEASYGLLVTKDVLVASLTPTMLSIFEKQAEFVPWIWLMPVWASLVPEVAKEVAYIAKAV